MKLTLSSLLLIVSVSAVAQEVIVPSETASRETLRLSAAQSTLRFGGLDLFPHAAGMFSYDDNRSEEHTSELQSLRHLVCRLVNDTATTEIYTLSLHDALPISLRCAVHPALRRARPLPPCRGHVQLRR